MLNFFKNTFCRLAGFRTDFQRLFFEREFGVLAGKKAANLWALLAIMTLTLLAFGFAIGGLDYLRERMDNPYTNWVEMPIGGKEERMIDSIRNHFKEKTNLDAFDLKSLTGYVVLLDPIFCNVEKGGVPKSFRGRSIGFDEELFRRVLSRAEGNWLAGWSSDDTQAPEPNPCGIVVTRRMLETLGYESPLQQRKVLVEVDSVPFFLDVIAVVKELPNLCDFLCTAKLSHIVADDFDASVGEDARKQSNHLDFVLSDRVGEEELRAWAMKTFADAGVRSVSRKSFEWQESEPSFVYDVTFNGWPKTSEMQSFYKQIEKEWRPKSGNLCFPHNDLICSRAKEDIPRPYYFAFNFSVLDKVIDFKNFMRERFKVEINMAQVEAKKNFAIVSRLTQFVSAILFFFSIASIVSFTDNLLRTHLEKIKGNLGTFMAFGLSNRFLVQAYVRILLVFLVGSALAAWLIAGAVALVLPHFLEKSFLVAADWRIGAAIGAVLVLSLTKVFFTIRNTLNQTPGDLIYGR